MGKVRNFVGLQLVRMNAGRFLVGMLQFALSFSILLEVVKLPRWYNFIIVPFTIVTVWTIGYLYERFGFRRAYEEEAARYFSSRIRKDIKSDD